jgi:hypothetical protein
MAITEAHSLLDAGELSWRYDAFSEAWGLMYDDYCLKTRFQALQLKVGEHELSHAGVQLPSNLLMPLSSVVIAL